jgi:uncharacterized protein (TIGR03435 family)
MPTIIAGIFLIALGALDAQSFDVAAIKLNPPGIFGGRVQFLAGGRFAAENVALNFLVEQAYGVRNYQVLGGPSWINEQHYDIQASSDSATEAQMRRMLQGLLADRFQLKIRRETRELPIYALVVAKNGPKIKPLKPGEGKRGGIGWDRDGLFAYQSTMEQIGHALENQLGRPVIDKTGLPGLYELRVQYDERRLTEATADSERPSIFTAFQDQLGLRLEAQRGAIEVLVIESAQRTPTGN